MFALIYIRVIIITENALISEAVFQLDSYQISERLSIFSRLYLTDSSTEEAYMFIIQCVIKV